VNRLSEKWRALRPTILRIVTMGYLVESLQRFSAEWHRSTPQTKRTVLRSVAFGVPALVGCYFALHALWPTVVCWQTLVPAGLFLGFGGSIGARMTREALVPFAALAWIGADSWLDSAAPFQPFILPLRPAVIVMWLVFLVLGLARGLTAARYEHAPPSQ